MLTVPALIAGLLFALGVPGCFGRRLGVAVMAAAAALCAIGAVAMAVYLLTDPLPHLLGLQAGASQAGALRAGPPGAALTLALDPLSGLFLLLLFVTGAACCVYGMGAHDAEDRRALPFFSPFIGAMALTLLAGDAFGLVLGFELMSVASWAMVLARHERADNQAAAQLYLGIALFGAACLIPALALLGLDSTFAAIRAAPPEGWRAGAVMMLVLLGAGSKAGLAPLHLWLPLAHPAAPSHASALMSGAMTKVAIYVILRVVFDLCGPGQPLWWGLPLLAAGTGSAVLGGLRANLESDFKSVLAASTIENTGLIAIGLGIALMARADDLPALSSLALAGALLHTLNHGVFKTLLFLAAGAVQHGAGSRALVRLGGLIHSMPATSVCVLVGAACLAAVPPTSGFASEWLLFQSVLAAPKLGGLAVQTGLTVVLAVMALAAALAASACVRLVGVAFLGRARSPRAAAAVDAGGPARTALIGLSVLSVVLGLLPGPALMLAEPAIRALAGSGMSDRASLLMLSAQRDAPGYAPLGVLAVLAVLGGAVALTLRQVSVPGIRRGPAWDCGFAAPPAWLPFGDPVTQYGPDAFGQPLRRSLGTSLFAARENLDRPEPGDPRPAAFVVTWADPAGRLVFGPLTTARVWGTVMADRMQFLTIRWTMTVMVAALVLFLALVAWLEAA